MNIGSERENSECFVEYKDLDDKCKFVGTRIMSPIIAKGRFFFDRGKW